MRIPSGVTDQYIYFFAVDATDFTTPETGLSSFTVYRSRNGGAAAAFTTPTVNETDSTNMAGVYELLLDEDMTIDSGDDEQEMVFHISHAGMAPVVRTITLFRPKVTVGNTLGVAADGDLSGNVDGNVVGSVASVTGAVGSVTGAVGSVTGNVGGIAGTINTLDALDTAQDSQHSTTQGKVDTAQADLDILTGTDGATLATAQGNYAPAKATDVVSGGAITTSGGVVSTVGAVTGNVGGNVAGDVQGNVDGSVASVTGSVGSVTGHTAQTGDTYALANGAAGFVAIDTVVDSIKAVTDTLNDPSVADILTTQMTESYAADGAAPTLAQALMLIQQALTEVAISGTTATIKKLDGTTTAATLTLDDGSSPTSKTRAT